MCVIIALDRLVCMDSRSVHVQLCPAVVQRFRAICANIAKKLSNAGHLCADVHFFILIRTGVRVGIDGRPPWMHNFARQHQVQHRTMFLYWYNHT